MWVQLRSQALPPSPFHQIQTHLMSFASLASDEKIILPRFAPFIRFLYTGKSINECYVDVSNVLVILKEVTHTFICTMFLSIISDTGAWLCSSRLASEITAATLCCEQMADTELRPCLHRYKVQHGESVFTTTVLWGKGCDEGSRKQDWCAWMK